LLLTFYIFRVILIMTTNLPEPHETSLGLSILLLIISILVNIYSIIKVYKK